MRSLYFSWVYLLASGIYGADQRTMSPETAALVRSRLIIVYDDSECRAVEGMADVDPNEPMHRRIALRELRRRLEWTRAHEFRGAAAAAYEPIYLQSTYLKALEMEITQVPGGLSLDDLERAAENLPCIKFVARDDVKFIENDLLTKPSVFNATSESYNDTTRKSLPGSSADASPHVISTLTDSVVEESFSFPNDPLFKDQWGLHGVNGTSVGVDVEGLWAETMWFGSEKMVVAIIDSGCGLEHPDLQGQFWRNAGETDCNDGIDNDGNGLIDDCYGWDFVENSNSPRTQGTSHGSAAAGIIAAKTSNGEGVAGICSNCRIMCLRFISGSEGTVANEVRAIDYAVRMGAKISNNSYGGYAAHGNRVEQEAIERAYRLGHLFVASAGNNNMNTDNSQFIHTPSGYNVPNIISVGASNRAGGRTPYSNYGEKTVHVFAPGHNIVSIGQYGEYGVNHGTSFAAPHVAGLAALVWSKYPELSNDSILRIVLESCVKNGQLAGEVWRRGECNEYVRKCGSDFPQPQWTSSEIIATEQHPYITFSSIRPFTSEDGLMALDKNPGLYEKAFDQRIPNRPSFAMSTPTTVASKSYHQDFASPVPTGEIRASMIPFGKATAMNPTVKRLVMAFDGASDLLNAGLDWVPTLSTIAKYVSPQTNFGIIPSTSAQNGGFGIILPQVLPSAQPYRYSQNYLEGYALPKGAHSLPLFELSSADLFKRWISVD